MSINRLEQCTLLLALVCLGCAEGQEPRSIVKRWNSNDQLRGWTVIGDDFLKAVEVASFIRNPDHSPYISVENEKQLSAGEAANYGKLNDQLHEKVRQAAHDLFDDVPTPEGFPERLRDEKYFTPFTYQNSDWYRPTQEVYVGVLTPYVTSKVLAKLQSLLCEAHEDWCIVVVGAKLPNFEQEHEIYVFSDQLIVHDNTAKAMEVPAGFLGR